MGKRPPKTIGSVKHGFHCEADGLWAIGDSPSAVQDAWREGAKIVEDAARIGQTFPGGVIVDRRAKANEEAKEIEELLSKMRPHIRPKG